MDYSPTFHKPLSKYGKKHLPMHVYILIMRSGLSKTEFFERYPDFNYHDEGFPRILLDKIQERKRARKERLRQAERDLERSIGKLSLKCPKKLRKKVEFLPSTSKVGRPLARVRPFALSSSPFQIVDISSDSDNKPIEEVPRVDNHPPSGVELVPQPIVEAIPQPGHSWEDLSPPSVQVIPPPSPAPDVELFSPPSVEIIPQVE